MNPNRFSERSVQLSAELKPVLDLLQLLNTPRSLTVYLLLKYEQYDDLTSLTIDPSDYVDPSRFRDDYLATECLSKYDSFPASNKREAAIKKFYECEEYCQATNQRLFDINPDFEVMPGHTVSVIEHFVSRYISRVLGTVDQAIPQIIDGCRFGPGASLDVNGSRVSQYNKMRHRPQSTIDFASLSLPIFNTNRFWVNSSLGSEGDTTPLLRSIDVVKGNKVVFVPKNSKTDRSIAIEPSLNSYFQLGIGSYLKGRLKKFGTDLFDQTNNQRLARIGSIDNSLCTIDLSSASDLLSQATVFRLFPLDWVHLLDVCRSKFFTLGDVSRRYEKWSSMGNGYTFELETLVFRALAEYACSSIDNPIISVYGDDIIIPSSAFRLMKSLLEFYGFKCNGKKTFHDSPFRESCGSHFFLGIDCKPFYVRSRLDDFGLVQLHNRCWEWSIEGGCYFNPRLLPLIYRIRRTTNVKSKWSQVHPLLGDTGLFPLAPILSRSLYFFPKYRIRTRRSKVRRGSDYYSLIGCSLATIGTDSCTNGFYPLRMLSQFRNEVVRFDPFIPPWMNDIPDDPSRL